MFLPQYPDAEEGGPNETPSASDEQPNQEQKKEDQEQEKPPMVEAGSAEGAKDGKDDENAVGEVEGEGDKV